MEQLPVCGLPLQQPERIEKNIDPFEDVKYDWFTMKFPSLDIEPHPDLPPAVKEAVADTIKILGLNEDEEHIEYCMNWLMAYCRGDITFCFLTGMAPFMAYELERQGYKYDICDMMVDRFTESSEENER